MIISFTGHRPNKLGNNYSLSSRLIHKIENSILEALFSLKANTYDTTFIVGMALGVDTIAAQIAIENRFPFIAAIPFKGQESKWFKHDKLRYYSILSKAKEIFVVDQNRYAKADEFLNYNASEIKYAPYKLQNRNIWMVDKSDVLISVWDGSDGGTKNCHDYAMSNGKTIVRINPREL